MLRQAVLNLALNACQAMPDGGTLQARAAGPPSRRRVEIVVEDTGVGIPPEHLPRIFDLYFTTKEKGSGIGLSMVFRIVQLHDGEVEVQSTPGRGTKFTLRFPQAISQELNVERGRRSRLPGDDDASRRLPRTSVTDADPTRGKIDLSHEQPGGLSARSIAAGVGVRDHARRRRRWSVRHSRSRRCRRGSSSPLQRRKRPARSRSTICRRRSRPRRRRGHVRSRPGETQKPPDPKPVELPPALVEPPPAPPPNAAPLLRTPATADRRRRRAADSRHAVQSADGLNNVNFQRLSDDGEEGLQRGQRLHAAAPKRAIKTSNFELGKELASKAEKLANELQGR